MRPHEVPLAVRQAVAIQAVERHFAVVRGNLVQRPETAVVGFPVRQLQQGQFFEPWATAYRCRRENRPFGRQRRLRVRVDREVIAEAVFFSIVRDGHVTRQPEAGCCPLDIAVCALNVDIAPERRLGQHVQRIFALGVGVRQCIDCCDGSFGCGLFGQGRNVLDGIVQVRVHGRFPCWFRSWWLAPCDCCNGSSHGGFAA